MPDLVIDTSRRIGISDLELFYRAYKSRGLSDYAEVAENRHRSWISHGEIPTSVENYCLDFWAQYGGCPPSKVVVK